jgi:hypothetical protein
VLVPKYSYYYYYYKHQPLRTPGCRSQQKLRICCLAGGCRNEGVAVLPSVQCALHRLICALSRAALWAPQVMLDLDAKGGDWNGQVKLGAPSFLGINYFQSVTPRLAAGGEFFWLQVQGRRFWFGRSFSLVSWTLSLCVWPTAGVVYVAEWHALCSTRMVGPPTDGAKGLSVFA